MTRIISCLMVCIVAGGAAVQGAKQPETKQKQPQLGSFSMSLAVKDLDASRAFYEKLGFHMLAGTPPKERGGRGYVIMQNDTSTIGLFQGMFPKNILTFNPGWDRSAKALPEFQDVREIQNALAAAGMQFTVKADESSRGPASFMVTDPDGNQILVDQHVPAPGK